MVQSLVEYLSDKVHEFGHVAWNTGLKDYFHHHSGFYSGYKENSFLGKNADIGKIQEKRSYGNIASKRSDLIERIRETVS